ncbi:hypothetical protein GCM10023259_068960 [Thermocatellispora tengchongensis]
MRDLAAGVHAGVGAPGDGEPGRRVEAQNPPQGRLDLTLHGTPAGLRGPAGETGAVVSEIEPDAYDILHVSLLSLP